jgi:hypothetical protein
MICSLLKYQTPDISAAQILCHSIPEFLNGCLAASKPKCQFRFAGVRMIARFFDPALATVFQTKLAHTPL